MTTVDPGVAPAAATPAPAAAAPAAGASVAADLLGGSPAPAPGAAAPAAAPGAAPAADGQLTGEAKPEGEQALKLPGKDATPEDWAVFYKSIGAPETADAYKLPVPEGDDGVFAKTASEWFKEAGVLPRQAEALAGKWNEYVASQMQSFEKAEADRIAALHAKNTAEKQDLMNEWGQRATENMEFAKRAVSQFLPKEKAADVIGALEGVLGYKGAIQFLHGIGKGLGEHDATVGMGQSAGQGGVQKSLAERMFPNMPN
jgi:hypothetical protein